LNYQGKQVRYGSLKPGQVKSQGTYVTHPWRILGKTSKTQYCVNGKKHYFPQEGDASKEMNIEECVKVTTQSSCASNQRWKVIYLDKATAIRTKGFNKDFGFHINRPFYIRSRMPMKRVAECHGANNVWLKRWRKNVKAQQWYFDEVTKTLKNNYWKSHSLDIQGNGGSTNIRCTTTNSRWW
jgi:hypothetical protein